MRALTQAARTICYATAMALDRAERGDRQAARQAAHARASLLTPMAKAFSTDIGVEVASLGVQVHGGMGFIEETGAAQLYRDARIAPIYEGTNGIQAIDLVTRKLPLNGGAVVEGFLGELRRIVEAVECHQRSGARLERRAARRSRRQLGARDHWMLAHSTRTPTRRSPARRPICGCSPLPPAAACWRSRRLPRCGSTPTALRASRWRAFLPRILPSRRPGSNAPSSKAAAAVIGADAALAQ